MTNTYRCPMSSIGAHTPTENVIYGALYGPDDMVAYRCTRCDTTVIRDNKTGFERLHKGGPNLIEWVMVHIPVDTPEGD